MKYYQGIVLHSCSIPTIVAHGNRKNGVDFGQTALIWLLYILTENDHRVSYVEDWSANHIEILLELTTNISLESNQLSDDYLGSLLEQLSRDESWKLLN